MSRPYSSEPGSETDSSYAEVHDAPELTGNSASHGVGVYDRPERRPVSPALMLALFMIGVILAILLIRFVF